MGCCRAKVRVSRLVLVFAAIVDGRAERGISGIAPETLITEGVRPLLRAVGQRETRDEHMVVGTLLWVFTAVGFVVVVLVLPSQSSIEIELLHLQGIVGEQ